MACFAIHRWHYDILKGCLEGVYALFPHICEYSIVSLVYHSDFKDVNVLPDVSVDAGLSESRRRVSDAVERGCGGRFADVYLSENVTARQRFFYFRGIVLLYNKVWVE